MKLAVYLILSVNISLSLSKGIILPGKPDEGRGCNEGEVCMASAQCSSAIADFKENKIRPRICSLQTNSVSVCCKKVDVSPTHTEQKCGSRHPIITEGMTEEQILDQIIGLNVIGGKEAEMNSLPWQAALGERDGSGDTEWFCGGAFIGENLVMTAAHCTKGNYRLDVVRLGAHNLSLDNEPGAEDFLVKKVVSHPQYSKVPIPINDIALLVLDTPNGEISLSSKVYPVCLPSPGDRLPPGAPVNATGWGARSERGDFPDTLHTVSVELLPYTPCAESYKNLTGEEIGPDILCAGTPEGGRDSCGGDSGGALIHEDPATETWTAVGVVSVGFRCAVKGFPGLYSKVSSYRDWIEEVRAREAGQ